MTNPLHDAVSETEFQEKVIEYAMLKRWRVHHSRPAITGGKWSTPIMGHAGLPDLVMARDYRVVLAELKSEKGTPTPEQEKWLDALGVGDFPLPPGRVTLGVYGVYLWKPSDWPEIEEVLK